MSGIRINNGVNNAGNVPNTKAGTLAQRPVAVNSNMLYVDTSTPAIYYDNGTWELIAQYIDASGFVQKWEIWQSEFVVVDNSTANYLNENGYLYEDLLNNFTVLNPNGLILFDSNTATNAYYNKNSIVFTGFPLSTMIDAEFGVYQFANLSIDETRLIFGGDYWDVNGIFQTVDLKASATCSIADGAVYTDIFGLQINANASGNVFSVDNSKFGFTNTTTSEYFTYQDGIGVEVFTNVGRMYANNQSGEFYFAVQNSDASQTFEISTNPADPFVLTNLPVLINAKLDCNELETSVIEYNALASNPVNPATVVGYVEIKQGVNSYRVPLYQ